MEASFKYQQIVKKSLLKTEKRNTIAGKKHETATGHNQLNCAFEVYSTPVEQRLFDG